jgi:ribosomal protein S18 acetylase RimI-like enzyme
VIIGRLAEEDLGPLLAIQHAFEGERARWTAETLSRVLHDRAGAGSGHLRIARLEGTAVGAVGWVPRGDVCHLSPLLAATEPVARALIELGLGEAGPASQVRAATSAQASHVASALQELGFAPRSESLDLSRPTRELAVPEIAPLEWRSITEVETSRLRALHDEAFRADPNLSPFDPDGFGRLVRVACTEASSVIVDGERYVGYLLATRHTDVPAPHAHIDFVGVLDAYRRRGLGRAMIARALGAAHRQGLPELSAMVSSLNTGSLELHLQSGFSVFDRRVLWQHTR